MNKMIIEEKTPQAEEEANKLGKDVCISLLREGKSVCLNASGGSMYPFVKDGDIIKVVPLSENDIKIGDIISVDVDNKGKAWFYVHRLVKIYKDTDKKLYVTKGDASNVGFDEPVGFKRIVGEVAEIERGSLKLNLKQPLWKYLNKHIAKFSLNHPGKLCVLGLYISLIIEWRRLPAKLIRRIRKRTFFTLKKQLTNAIFFVILSV